MKVYFASWSLSELKSWTFIWVGKSFWSGSLWITAHVPGLHSSLLSRYLGFGTAPWKTCSNLLWVLIRCSYCFSRERLQLRFHRYVHSNSVSAAIPNRQNGRWGKSPSSFYRRRNEAPCMSFWAHLRQFWTTATCWAQLNYFEFTKE